MAKSKFYICPHCKNIIGMIQDVGVPVFCCGQKMEELVPNTVDASTEKHLPVVAVDGDTITVTVGTAEHPMQEEHLINWVYVQTEKGGQRKNLNPGETPSVSFVIKDDQAVAVYAYCNLHGLWMTEV